MIPAGPLEAAALECLGSFLMLNNLIRSVAEPAAGGEINPPHATAPPAPRSFPGSLAFFYGALNTSFNQLYNFNLAQLLTCMDDKVRRTPQIAAWFNGAIFHGLLAAAADRQPSPAQPSPAQPSPAQAAGAAWSCVLGCGDHQPRRYFHCDITNRDMSPLHNDMIATNDSF